MSTPGKLDLAALRAKLANARGQQYWRSLEELAGTEEFEEILHREFPQGASEWASTLDRRSFLKLMGASLALAGLSACGVQPEEKILPYVRQPQNMVPGKSMMFATAIPMDGYGTGVLVRSDMGHPTKIEGNPEHPASLGATDVFTQASILTLYDPDRAQPLQYRGQVATWDTFTVQLRNVLTAQEALRGAGLRILTTTVTSPTLAAQMQQLLQTLPEARWCQYDPAGRHSAREGARMTFGDYVETIYRVEEADILLSLDSDFLTSGAGSVRYQRGFAGRRKPNGDKKMNRLYVIESAPSNTGAAADHRLAVPPSRVEILARAFAAGAGVSGAQRVQLSDGEQRWVDAVARDLETHRGTSLVVPGDYQPPVVHALAHAINATLGNAGRTVFYTDPVEARPSNQLADLGALTAEMRDGKVDVLIIIGGNPVYNTPPDLGFGDAMQKVGTRIRLGLYDDETSNLSHWYIPEAHPLESWSDTRAFDGTVSLMQPLIAPLFNGKSAHELLAELLGQPASAYDSVRAYWQGKATGNFEEFWTTSLNSGVVADSALPERTVNVRGDVASWGGGGTAGASTDPNALEVILRPDPTIWDGSFANNAWLQELPKPWSKLTWDNAAYVAPATAQRLGLEKGEMIEIDADGRKVEAPVFFLPGQPDGALTAYFGYGRTRAGKVGTAFGFNAYMLQTSQKLFHATGVQIRKTGKTYPLAVTQEHHSMEGRAPVRQATLDEYMKNPGFPREQVPPPPRDKTLYPQYPYEGYAWGMSIDLNACTGCSACVVACQAENNIPTVGKEQVMMSREMHWIRIDQYFTGDLDNPQVLSEPMACVHCETAPCEVVCPVAATVHDSEGLNVMVYNRCVGTRYCSNNCPYKVRRFNFLEYTKYTSPLELQRNPNVTVRSKGVMEKCTYCTQRISAARIEAKKDDRSIRDGEVVTACQAACPSRAIVFGDINDKNSQVSQAKADPRGYGVLAELNTHPRTTYLAKITNPNPALVSGQIAGDEHRPKEELRLGIDNRDLDK